MAEPPLAQDTPTTGTLVWAVQALTKDDTIDPVFMPGSYTPAGSFSFTPKGSSSGCRVSGSVTARYSYPMPGAITGARAASPRPAILLCPINKKEKIYGSHKSSFYLGNTAQFPPYGLSTVPAAATLRIMRYRLKTRKISLSAHCADTFCLCRCHGNRRPYEQYFSAPYATVCNRCGR